MMMPPKTLQTDVWGKKGAGLESVRMRLFWARKDAFWTQKPPFGR